LILPQSEQPKVVGHVTQLLPVKYWPSTHSVQSCVWGLNFKVPGQVPVHATAVGILALATQVEHLIKGGQGVQVPDLS